MQQASEAQWYFGGDDALAHGPWTWEAMRGYAAAGSIGPETLVWSASVGGDWRPAAAVPGLLDEPVRPLVPPVAGALRPPIQAGGVLYPPPVRHRVPSHLGFAICVTVACFWPLGAAAVYHACRVDQFLSRGDVAAARTSSDKALRWCWASLSVGVLLMVVMLVAIAIAEM